MENEKFEIDNPLGKLILENTFISDKLDVLIETNAMILSKLGNTDYEEERKKLYDKVSQLSKFYLDDLKPTVD